jgi:hypothetical protein
MSHRCKICGREVRKSESRRQHERDVHIERPRQRRMDIARGDIDRGVLGSRREAIARSIPADAHPGFRPFGGVDLGLMMGLVGTLSDVILARDGERENPLALEPPTIEGEIV